jgi:hypothetical protein
VLYLKFILPSRVCYSKYYIKKKIIEKCW